MSILDSLTQQMKDAMRAHDQMRLDALRMLISAIKYAMVDTPEMNEEAVVAVLSKEAKKRKEAAASYRLAGRIDQAEKEEFELSLVEEYLPKMLSEEEAKVKISDILKNTNESNMGEVMKMVMSELKGQADGGMVSKIVKEMLAK